jgi:general secretion pathway protein G
MKGENMSLPIVLCQTCKTGQLVQTKQYRMSGPVVIIGYILLVPSIIGIIVSVGMFFAGIYMASKVGVDSSINQSKIRAAKSEMSTLCTALELFRMDVGRYPTEPEGLRALVQVPAGVTNWGGPYLKPARISSDPWDMPYKYQLLTNGQGQNDVLIVSYGPNQRPGPGNITSKEQNPTQLPGVDDTEIAIKAHEMAGSAAAIGGTAGALCFGIASFVSGLLGWLLVMKKKILQCNYCKAVVAAS